MSSTGWKNVRYSQWLFYSVTGVTLKTQMSGCEAEYFHSGTVTNLPVFKVTPSVTVAGKGTGREYEEQIPFV